MAVIVGTGVFATPEELEEVKRAAERAARTPVITIGSSPSLSALAWTRAQHVCHSIALAHGLPEIPGFYGLDTEGQFIREGEEVKS